MAHRDACNADLQALLSQKSSADWIAILNDAGVPCGPIYKMDEMWADPQVRHLNMARPVTNKFIGSLSVVRNAANLSGSPDTPYRGAPELGEHTEEILAEFGFTEEEIESVKRDGVV